MQSQDLKISDPWPHQAKKTSFNQVKFCSNMNFKKKDKSRQKKTPQKTTTKTTTHKLPTSFKRKRGREERRKRGRGRQKKKGRGRDKEEQCPLL